MSQVVDYSFTHPAPATIKAHGYKGVMRYLSPGPNAKNLTEAEKFALLNAGLSIGVVWETVANRAAQGFDAGAHDAQLANGQADSLAIPESVTIYYAVDFDAVPSVVRPYFLGVMSVHRRPVGVYGGYSVCEAILDDGLAAMAWQTVAWSGGRHLERAVLYQRADRAPVPIPGTDVNDCLAPDWGQWPRPGPAPQPPPLQEDDMVRLMRPDGQPTVYVVSAEPSKWAFGDEALLKDYANRFGGQILPPSVGGPTVKLETVNGVAVEVVNPLFLSTIPTVK